MRINRKKIDKYIYIYIYDLSFFSSYNYTYSIQASRDIYRLLNNSWYWKMETVIILQQIYVKMKNWNQIIYKIKMTIKESTIHLWCQTENHHWSINKSTGTHFFPQKTLNWKLSTLKVTTNNPKSTSVGIHKVEKIKGEENEIYPIF